MRRARFQNGWLKRKQRSDGEVWYYNFREYPAQGKPITRSVKIGALKKYPTEAAAWREVEKKHINVNRDVTDGSAAMTVSELAAHYRQHELTHDDEEGKASTTRDSYESYIDNHILPKWGSSLVSEVKAVSVESWLKTHTCKPRKQDGAPRPMAKATRAKIRNVFHILFQHAIRYEFTDRNPITAVRASTKRQSTPDILDVHEFPALFAELKQRERAMVITDAGSGLRRSELFALKWQDVDLDLKQANVRRSIVHNTKRERVGVCKTEASRAPVPLDDFMLDELAAWKGQSQYSRDTDWVFASPHCDGAFPYWPDTILERFIRPAALRAKITKHIGWHTFRRSYSTLLKANGEDPKVVQELMRHANMRITMDTYTQAIGEHKRAAQSKVIRMISKKLRPEAGQAQQAGAD